MIKIERKFPRGYAKPVHRGIHVSTDSEARTSMPLDQVIYDALGDSYDEAFGAHLAGITVSIEIEDVVRPN